MPPKRKRQDTMSSRTRSNTVIHRPDWITATAMENTHSSTTADQGKREPLNLLTLPADIRNQIYHLICHHHENQGSIAPAITPYQHHDSPYVVTTYAIINGATQFQAIICAPAGDYLQRIESQGYRSDQDQGRLEAIERHLDNFGSLDDHVISPRTDGVWYYGGNSETFSIAHVCKASCLHPPVLARVNRQLRQEALSYFYGSNKFVFNFGVREDNELERDFVEWWRRLDEYGHLPLLEHLELVKWRREHSSTSYSLNVIQDRIIIRRLGGSKTPIVELHTGIKDDLQRRVASANNTTKTRGTRNLWRDIRLDSIADLFKHEIETHGLTACKLEMLLQARTFFGPTGRSHLGSHCSCFNYTMLTFMEDVKGGKRKKGRMVTRAKVTLGLRRREHGSWSVKVVKREDGDREGV